MIRYCFVSECYVGIMTFHEDGTISMSWEPDENLTELGKRFKKYVPLENDRMIKLFISERAISPLRPDRPVWLSFVGLENNATELEIFLAGHGVSCNDTFWIDTVKSPQRWYDKFSKRLPD